MSDSAEQVQTASADLAAWLRQQLDADTRRATELKSWAQGADFGVFIGDPIIGPFGGQSPIRNWGTGNDITHLADPTRVLRAVEAKRQLLSAANVDCPPACSTEHSFSGSCALRWMGPVWEEGGLYWVRDETGTVVPAPPVVTAWHLRLLAAEYADRPGYAEAVGE